jgi:hypothetical protein
LPLEKDFGPIIGNFACGEHIDRKDEWLSRRVAFDIALSQYGASSQGD